MSIYRGVISLTASTSLRSLRRVAIMTVCGSVLSAGPLPRAFAQCINFYGGSNQYNANLASTASPFIWAAAPASFGAAYDDHNTNTLMVGDLNNPTPTGIAINTSSGLGDVTATYLNGVSYLAFLSPSLGMAITTSSNTLNWGSPHSFAVPGAGPLNALFTPALQAYNGKLYAAYVVGTLGTAQGAIIYLASSSDGVNWTQLGSVNASVGTRSRPSLVVFNGNLFIGYTGSGAPSGAVGAPYVGPVVEGSTFAPNVIQQGGYFGNSNHNKAYAGILLVPSGLNGATLYLLGQGTDSSQTLYAESSTTGNNFPAPSNCGYQLRYTPTGTFYGGYTTINFQGDHNTNVWYATQ